jgi:hypothetical protein
MAAPAQIEVKGLKETRKAFKDLGADSGWREPFKDAYRSAASIAEAEGKSRAGQSRPNVGGGIARVGGQGVAAIRGKGTTTAATLMVAKGVPWFGGSNFGTKGAYRQFPPKGNPDHFLYSGVAAKREEIENQFLEAIGHALDTAFR